MNVRGWVRLWLVLVVVWVPLVAWQYSSNLSRPSRVDDVARVAAVVMAVPVFALLVGFVLAWVWRGFIVDRQ